MSSPRSFGAPFHRHRSPLSRTSVDGNRTDKRRQKLKGFLGCDLFESRFWIVDLSGTAAGGLEPDAVELGVRVTAFRVVIGKIDLRTALNTPKA
jgi:hypothetical protein